MSVGEVIPLWLLESPDSHAMGFGYRPKQIGALFSIGGGVMLAAQLFVFPHVVKRVGYLRLVSFLAPVVALTLAAIPWAAHLPRENDALPFAVLGLGNAVQKTLGAWVNTCWLVFINNSSPTELKATVNGVAQAAHSFIAPSTHIHAR